MIGEVIRTHDNDGVKFGLLVENEYGNGKVYIPCNELLWELKKEELKNIPLIPQKVEIKFIKE